MYTVSVCYINLYEAYTVCLCFSDKYILCLCRKGTYAYAMKKTVPSSVPFLSIQEKAPHTTTSTTKYICIGHVRNTQELYVV